MEPPDENIERYDRQIRLWGQHGQNKCSNSKVCLVNANTLGSEILKGLCLAGIGSFTILDSNKLSAEDVDSNFLSESLIGKSRGDSVKNMLLDLNEDVKGDVFPLELYLPTLDQSTNNDYQSELLSDVFSGSDEELNFWKQFNCIITASFLNTNQIKKLSRICWSLSIPLVVSKSIGFYGMLRIQMRDHMIVDTHPEFSTKPPSPECITTSAICDETYLTASTEDAEEDQFLTITLGLKAMDIFLSTYGRLPGCQDDQVETDITKLKNCVKQMISKTSIRSSYLDQCLYELCRYGGAEIHTTSAFLGGCVCQEAIKIITNQYTPVNDTLVYDAMEAMTKTLKSSSCAT